MGSSRWTAQDTAAALVALFLAIGVVGCSLLQIEVPAAMSGPFGASTTWLFIRSLAQAGNENAPRN